LWAQVEPVVKTPPGVLHVKSDSSQVKPDSLTLSSDSTKTKSDSTKVPAKKGDIETTINYSARDSIFTSMDNKMVWLYGEAKITYGEIQLEAEEVVIDYVHNTVTAHGIRDSLGHVSGYPVFKNGQELYETKDIIYNFKTKRAAISEVVTQQGEGYLHGDKVFKNEKGELLSLRNSYTTCNLEHPHYRIRATKTKAIPNDKIVAGPFYFEFNEIPLPIGFLFGMFPAQRTSKSGIIFPSYGEDRRRGFNLRNGGYFFDINDYVKLALTADIYSKGGYSVYARSNYIQKYHYSGSVNFSVSHTKTADKIESPIISNDFYLTWSHSPQSKGTGRFSASVNAATSTYNKNNNMTQGLSNELSTTRLNNITTKLSSNVSYSKKFTNTPLSLGVNFSHNQDLVTKIVDLPFPVLTLNMANQYPFQRQGKTGFFDNFSVGYSMAASNRITNNLGRLTPTATKDSIAPFNFQNLGTFFQNAKKGIRHTIPMSFSFKALKYFTISPSVSYDERWYFEKLNWTYTKVNSTYQYVSKKEAGFNRIANYSVSTGLTTRLYGMYNFKRGSVKAIRHVINPNISFAYTPNFAVNKKYFDQVKVPNTATTITGDSVIVYKSKFDGFVYGGSNTGKSGSIGFGIGNNLEMKVKSEKDTVARKVSLLNNLSINSSYNLMADSFKLAPFSMAANTNVLNNLLNMNISASLDPYYYETYHPGNNENITREKRTREYAWNGGGVGRITNGTLALSTNLNPKGRKKDQETRDKVGKSNLPEQVKQDIIANPNAYIDFNIPWNLNVSYNANYTHSLNSTPKVTQTLQFSGDISISKMWKINFNSGYHFETKQFTQTNISLGRDMHCWTMHLTWVPFGAYQSYNFVIAVKASILQDLKLERRKPFLDNNSL
jgi:lipopolysaccharide export system protein LptA